MLSQAGGNRLTEPLRSHVHDLPAAWRELLRGALETPSFAALERFVDGCVARGMAVYPREPFRVMQLVDPQDVRVVIVGQDPYHGPGQAHGLAFSVPSGVRCPPSLRNIFVEVAREFGGQPRAFDNDLTRWARQGVLLLNTSLTVADGQPASHARKGWEAFTDAVITQVARDPSPKVFMLWGGHAQAKRALLPADGSHLVLTANHPSPLSARRPPAPFLGCGHFSQANDWLAAHGREPVAWL
ncbi:uracil-DNA glycosylase [Pigmentiphaga soli]|uniref:Uracil-DNA glycosylase n=1 Tax=Pigmentiphaga soli TaxID=1007095 RepID=A0ABP8HRU5_9BURK